MSQPSADAFEDGIDLQIGLLESSLPQDQTAWSGYPFPPLLPTGEEEMRTFRTILLENAYLRVTILPGLGGRVVSLFDKRTGTETLRRHPAIVPSPGGRRGAFVREGIQLFLDGQERLNSMGNVSTQFEVASEENSEAAVWIAETVSGTGLSFHVRFSLPENRAELRVEARVFNRWLCPQPYNGALMAYVGEGKFNGTAFYSEHRDAGLAMIPDLPIFEDHRVEDGFLGLSRFSCVREMAARQVDAWSLTVVPLSGLRGCLGASREAAASVVEGVLRVQTSELRMGHKLLMLTEGGETLEAPVDLYPEHVLEIPLNGLKPVELVLKNPAKEEILRCSALPESPSVIPLSSPAPISADLNRDASEAELLRATFEIGSRHLAFTLLGMKALAAKQPAKANEFFEQALNFNAEDPLLWWAKAVAARLDNVDNQAEILNAHYLAPMEPALRAEGFLSQPINLDPEPNRLLAPLEENPEEFIEVACLFIECGLFDQASRWIDESIRHRDLPMLRYLMAFCLLKGTRLQAEAFDQVRIAARTAFGPPFPFRVIERVAIATLHEVFPDDERLSHLATLTEG